MIHLRKPELLEKVVVEMKPGTSVGARDILYAIQSLGYGCEIWNENENDEKKDSAHLPINSSKIAFSLSTNTHKTNTHTEIPRRPYFLSAVAKTHHHDSIHLVAKPTREDAFGEVLRAVRGG